MTRLKFAGFAVAAVSVSLIVTLAAMLAVDLYLHRRAERSAGLNRWGYRGPVLGRKQAGELRVAMLGGSTVFGYGGPWHEAIPALLERMLNERTPGRPVHVINLGFNNEGAYAFLPTLQDFRSLDADIVFLYEGYNDLPGDERPNTAVFRQESPVFRLTGYFPILPAMLREKALSLRSGGNLSAAYRAERGEDVGKVVFKPNVADRTSASALEAASSVANALSRQLGRLSEDQAPQIVTASEAGCPRPWINYCDSMFRAITYARSEGMKVVVAGQPLMIDKVARLKHERQQRELADMLKRNFGNDPHVRYLDLGHTVDLSDRNLSFDEMHLGLDGNLVIARALVEPVLDIDKTQ